MAFSITMLAWGVIEYWDVYRTSGELEAAIDSLKWGTDYLLKAHVAPNVLYGQVGEATADHRYWGRPEDMSSNNRPAYKIDRFKPGSDLAAETAAAMAATSLAIRRKENGVATRYVRRLITHAKDLFNFASTYKKLYHISIPNANYTSKGLLYLHEWSPLRYAANTAFICLMAADAGIDPTINAAWGRRQIHYMLGDTGRSYVVGFGSRYPLRPHHRASSCPPRPQTCNWSHKESDNPNHFILNGALVGGPDYND
uniref:Endoglucanase n=1 Tax=Ciona savignyi TaxID=51511 RepID=H2ZAZ6_CIOSA